jgi:trehalose/maltose transport system permease protein
MTPATFIPKDPETFEIKPTFENYRTVFKNKQFLHDLLNSLIVAGSTTTLSLIIGSFGAFALGNLRFRGKTPSSYVILSMTMFPQIAVLTGLYAIVRFLRIPAIPSMILSYLLFTLPFSIWVLTAFFKGLPLGILQAAQVDGATLFQTFRLILLPLSAPALVTTGLLSFINAWNEYLFALTFTVIEPDARTVTVAVAFFGGSITPQAMAAALVTTIPAVILISIFHNRITSGLTGIEL